MSSSDIQMSVQTPGTINNHIIDLFLKSGVILSNGVSPAIFKSITKFVCEDLS